MRYATAPAPDLLGWVYPDSCAIYLNERERKTFADPVVRCVVIVHEWGHLAGQKHSTDPDNIMNPVVPFDYWRCRNHQSSDSKLTPT